MSFQQDIAGILGLENSYCRGLQALRAFERSKIRAMRPRRITGSADIDSALSDRFPQDPRWDYTIACMTDNQLEILHWVEVHPADGTGTIGEIHAKLTWLNGWLDNEGARLNTYRRKIVWIASGRSAFQQNSPQLKKLVLAGVYFAGGHYAISE
jgi:hypothetical protein